MTYVDNFKGSTMALQWVMAGYMVHWQFEPHISVAKCHLKTNIEHCTWITTERLRGGDMEILHAYGLPPQFCPCIGVLSYKSPDIYNMFNHHIICVYSLLVYCACGKSTSTPTSKYSL